MRILSGKTGMRNVSILPDQSVLLDCGPASMIVSALLEGRPCPDLCAGTLSVLEETLRELSGFLPILRRRPGEIRAAAMTGCARTMTEAVQAIGDPLLTPMAAIAGTVADRIADDLAQKGASRIFVNNGGDIAIRLRPDERISIGISRSLSSGQFDTVAQISGTDGIGGVCTSGLGGRSLTLGIADAVTVFAKTAALADAAATHLADCSLVDSPAVKRVDARLLDPDTDLAGLYAVSEVGQLTQKEKTLALQQVLTAAVRLPFCAVIADIQGKTACYPTPFPITMR